MDNATPNPEWNEADRLAALARYSILDTPPEQAFDDVARTAAQIIGTPMAAISLIDEKRQWFKAEIGIGLRETPLADSICAVAMLERDGLVVCDASRDPRLAWNSLVSSGLGLRFYAGAVLETPDGYPIGALCVLDTKPRTAGLTPEQRFVLKTLAQQVMNQLELRRVVSEQTKLLEEQRRIEAELRAERDCSRRLLEGMDEGFVSLDCNFRIRQISAGGLRMDGRTADQVLGLTHWDAWPGSEQLAVGGVIKRAMQEKMPASVEQLYEFPDGRHFWLDIRAYPADDGLAIFYRNITARKKAEAKLRETAARLQFTLEAAQIGEWELDLVRDTSYRSLRHDQCLGYSKPVPEWSFKKFLEHVHPDDREFVSEQFKQALNELKDWHLECRVIWPDQSLHWIALHGSIYHTGAVPTHMTGIIYDITERKQAEEDLRRADRRKDEFLAMLAHELRNPLAPISAAADLLSLVQQDESIVRQTSDIISRQVHHMSSLIDDLLDVSRVTRGLVLLDKRTLDLKHIIADAVEQVRPLIESRAHHLQVHLSPDLTFVFGDKKRLVQVLANLLNNAAKYTPEGGNIVLAMEVSDHHVILAVRDDGIGMAPDLAAQAFELFAQAERNPDRSQGGLGIGLALVKSLVELHGGTVRVHSAGPGAGSEFTVCLPRLEHPEEPDEKEGNKAQSPLPDTRLKILVVDDNADAASMLALFLRRIGHHVEVECQSSKVLERTRAVMPDVCLLDIGLPDIDGYELARRLRECPETADIALIAVSGYGQRYDKGYAVPSVFDDYFVKPVDTRQLSSMITKIAARRRGMQYL